MFEISYMFLFIRKAFSQTIFQLCKKPQQNNMFCVENKHLFILFFQLKFFDYTITEQLLGNTTELFRLFKFDEFFMFDKVEKAFVNANKTMIAKALNSAVEVRSIDNQVCIHSKI